MKRFFFVIIIIPNCFFVTAKNSFFSDSTVINFTSSTLIELHPICRIGIGNYIKPKTMLLAEIGFGKNMGSRNVNYNRFQARVGVKHFFYKEHKADNFYYFGDIFYNKLTILLDSSGYFKAGNTTPGDTSVYTMFDNSTKKLNKLGGNIGIGFITPFFRKIKLDLYFGMGLAERTIKYIKMINQRDELLLNNPRREWGYSIDNTKPGVIPVFSMKLGFNIVYQIGK